MQISKFGTARTQGLRSRNGTGESDSAGMLANPKLQKMRLSSGIDLAFQTAGDSNKTAVVLLHGLPNSSRNFRDVIEPLSRSAFVVAPDLPGFGDSDVLPKATFAGFADCIEELLARLNVKERFIYLHDFGSPVGLQLAMRAPHLVRGLIIQNANAHESGHGPAMGSHEGILVRAECQE